MRRQQLRRAVKTVFIGQIGGGDWVERKLTCGNLPIFVVMIPQESGIRAGGSINEK